MITMGITSSRETREESLQSNPDLPTGEDASIQNSQGGWAFMQIIDSLSLFRRRQGPDLYDDGKTYNKDSKNKKKAEYNRYNKRYLDGQTPLTLAIRESETNVPDGPNLHPALRHPDVDVNYPELQQTGLYSYGECPPLIVAVKTRNPEIVALLLGRGARVNDTDFNKHSSLYYAAEIGNLKIFKFLMDLEPILSAASDVEDPLHAACRNGHNEIVRRLVDAGAAINPEKKSFVIPPVLLAAENNHEDICLCLLDNLSSGNNKLKEDVFIRACWFGSKRVVQYLIQNGTNVNAISDNNTTALVHAIRSGDLSRCERELKTAQGEKRIQLFSDLRSVLKESVEIISLLCENDANLEVETGLDQVVPLELCLKKGNIPAAILLLKHGAKADVQFDRIFETRLFRVDHEHFMILLQFLYNVPKSIYNPITNPYSIRSLKDSCRHVIRSSVRGQFVNCISILPTLRKLTLPTSLKEYLCYSEIDISEIVDNFQLLYFTELT